MTPVLAAVVFAADALLPLGVGGGVFYAAVVLPSIAARSRRFTFLVAGGCSVLTLVGLALSAPAAAPWIVAVDRAGALVAIWAVALAGAHGIDGPGESSDGYRSLMAGSPDAAVVTDSRGRILDANSVAEDLFGYERDELIGRPVEILVPAAKRHRHADLRSDYLDRPTTRHMDPGREFQALRKDGSSFPAEIALIPHGSAGDDLTVTGIIRDMTEAKERREKLERAERLRELGQMANGIAHDFNNLLTVITSVTDLLLETDRERDPQERQDLLEIKSAADRASELTKRLLAFGRRGQSEPRVVNPSRVISDLVPMLRRLIPENVRIREELPEDTGHVRADPVGIEQIVTNLVINARDAISGAGTIVLECKNVDLEGALVASDPDDEGPPGPYVLISVTDDGVGMDAGTRAHAFEPFFTTRFEEGGTGLGLATVYGAVKQSGGHVSIHSEPEVGTTVKVHLPRVETEAEGPLPRRTRRAR